MKYKKQTPLRGLALPAIPICTETILCQKGQAFTENLCQKYINPKNNVKRPCGQENIKRR